jgi:site-specific DNA-cytosine methylase
MAGSVGTETTNISGNSDFTRKMDVLMGQRESVNAPRQNGNAKLNPRWVETLMGVPVGWTSPEPVGPTKCTNRTDELRLLGNGVVPATAELAFRTLLSRFTRD